MERVLRVMGFGLAMLLPVTLLAGMLTRRPRRAHDAAWLIAEFQAEFGVEATTLSYPDLYATLMN